MSEHALGNAKAWLGDIVTTMRALAEAEATDKMECGQCEGTGEITGGLGGDGEDEECPVCDGTGEIDHEESADEIRERVQEEPLSVQVRGGWYSPGDHRSQAERQAEEYEILLTTGGPALRIYGDLDEYNQPGDQPRLQWQDWGTPWTDYPTNSEECKALALYSRQFYFGE